MQTDQHHTTKLVRATFPAYSTWHRSFTSEHVFSFHQHNYLRRTSPKSFACKRGTSFYRTAQTLGNTVTSFRPRARPFAERLRSESFTHFKRLDKALDQRSLDGARKSRYLTLHLNYLVQHHLSRSNLPAAVLRHDRRAFFIFCAGTFTSFPVRVYTLEEAENPCHT